MLPDVGRSREAGTVGEAGSHRRQRISRKSRGRRAGRGGPRFNVSLEFHLFHCAVADCDSRLKPPVYKCEAGHRLCHNCRGPRGDGHCGICDRATTFVHCPDVDMFIDSAKVPCPYESFGCDRSVVYHEIPEHLDACAYAPCPCLVPGCHVAASPPPMLRDHLAADHAWTVHKFAAYAKAYTLRIPAAESQRLLVVEADDPRLFLMSLRWRGAALAVSVSCVRRSDAAGPDFKCCLWATAPTPPDARRQMERRVMMETDVASCAVPGGPALENGMWMHVMPEMLLGPSQEVQLRIRIDKNRPAFVLTPECP
ncbi:hypothetical protein EJB05_31835, partial [Eragrostis curvula]